MALDTNEGRFRDAYHEAAHTVFFYHAGASITYAMITNSEGNGRVEWESPAQSSPSQALILAAGSLAGYHAGERLLGQGHVWPTFEEFERRGSQGLAADAELMGTTPELMKSMMTKEDGYFPTDEEHAYEDLQSAVHHPQSPWSSLKEGYSEACECVAKGLSDWWPEIEAVAEALLKSKAGRIEGNEIVQVIQTATPGEAGKDTPL